jgi:UDP-GlcNAc3NAcA epimerase
MKIVSIVGARPQFIKAAVVCRALRAVAGVRETLVHTGQHYDENMSDVFFSELEIPKPDVHLGIGSGSHGVQTGRMLEAIERTLLETKPDCVLVYGDTNSTLAGALAAAKLHVPVAHVEAGLRSFNRRMPEEINRVVADHLSTMLFAPTQAAVDNLVREGIGADRTTLTGDVMYDVSLYYGAKAQRESTVLRSLDLAPRGFVLATVHRAENTDDPARLTAIIKGLSSIAEKLPVVLPVHPRTRGAMQRAGLQNHDGRLKLIEPVGYLDMLLLERSAAVIATDSGGVQKEAFFYETPCVTLRYETEWVELVELGWNRLCPPISADEIYKTVLLAIGSKGLAAKPYGDGDAANRIAQILVRR